MNLQDILNHRTTCLIHKAPIKPSFTNRRCKATVVPEGLLLTRTSPKMESIKCLFKYDGTWQKDDNFKFDAAYNKHDEDGGFFKSPLYVYMMCDQCHSVPIMKSRTLGFTTLTDIRHMQNYYTFIIMGDAEGNYAVNPVNEKVKYYRNDKFYHLDVDLATNQANFKMGTNAGTDLLEQLIEGVMSLDVPNFNVTKIQDIEQLITKFKLYNLFS